MPRKLTIEYAQNLAKSKNGKCLSTEYIGSQLKLLWQCEFLHEWSATYSQINSRSWCPECSDTTLTIEDAQKLAKSKGGKCLSTVYINSQSKLDWECEFNHKWDATYGNIHRVSWCPECAGHIKHTIQDAQNLAAMQNGKCLSTEYINCKEKLKWECEFNHIWEIGYTSISIGRWCNICHINTLKNTLEDAQKLAALRNGQCISFVYVNSETNLKWKCENNHVWNAPYSTIRGGSWCAKCVGTDKKTINDAIRLAENKNGKCLSKEYINSHTDLIWKCENNHIWDAPYSRISSGAWCLKCLKNTIEDAQELAKNKGGKCLSETYINSTTNLDWKCNFGHKWPAQYANVRNGTWCPYCSISPGRVNEKLVGKFLLNNNINFNKIKIKLPINIRKFGKYTMPDFFISSLNLIIEYNGKQHYELDPFSKSLEKKKEQLVWQQKRDEQLRQYCKENNINIIEIDGRKYKGKTLLPYLNELLQNNFNLEN